MDSMNQACDEEINASKSLVRRRARFTEPNVRSTIQRFGSTINPLTSAIGAFDHAQPDPARLVCGAGGFVTSRHRQTRVNPGTFLDHGLQQVRQRVAILNVRRCHLTLDRQAESIDCDVAFAALDLFARVVALGATRLGGLDGLAVDDDDARRRVLPLCLTNSHDQDANDLFPQTAVAPGIEAVLHGGEGRKVRPDGLGTGSNGCTNANSSSDRSLA
jgi:hypothetical protein